MQASKVSSLIAAIALATTVGSAAYAAPASHSGDNPAKPVKGTWNVVRSTYLAGHFTVRKHKSGFEISGFKGALKPAATGLYCTTVGKFTIPGTIPIKKIKVSSKQKVWAVGKKFSDDAIVPVNVTMKFKTVSVKAKLSMHFDAHQKDEVGSYSFNDNGGYLYESAFADCGTVFSIKHQ
jgi:hypothetical protein